MAVSSTSSAQSVTSGLWAQLQQQRAQRSADQAEQQARTLRAKAQDAQSVADRAQENARSLKVESNQAQGAAVQARQGLATQKAVGEVQGKLTDLHEQIGNVLQADTVAEAPAVLAPVINVFGQQTGSLVNVTA